MHGTVRYFALTDNNEMVTGLGKVVHDEQGLRGYQLHEGCWIENSLIAQCVFDMSVGDEVDRQTAAKIAAELGGTSE